MCARGERRRGACRRTEAAGARRRGTAGGRTAGDLRVVFSATAMLPLQLLILFSILLATRTGLVAAAGGTKPNVLFM